MEIVILPDPEAVARAAADLVVKTVTAKPDAVLGLATGSSPLPAYDELVRRFEDGQVSFAAARAFTLDEYVGLPVGHPASYARVIRDEFTDRVDFVPDSVQGPDGAAPDLQAACQSYEQDIAAAGGVDLQILGVGSDGHLAFNEPGSSLSSRTRVKTLTEQTRSDNARFFGDRLADVPHHCLTQGIGTILEARRLLLLGTGRHKSEVIRRVIEGPVAARWPASVVQWHPAATLMLDEAAASMLELGDYYRYVQAHKDLVPQA